MGRRRTVRKNNGHTRGSSLMYVVLLMTLLAVLSSGYMAISRYNMKAALKNRRYMEAQLSAKTIHRSFCEAVSSGESPAMNLIWQNFQEDCDRVREEFDAMMDEEEAEEGEDGELKAESFSSEEDTDTTDAEEELRWERYLYHALGNKKSMMADIVFDDRDGSVMVIGKPYRSSRGDDPEVKVYLNGNGVYRYYEGS